MALTKMKKNGRRFVLVQSLSNPVSDDQDDDLQPYHISIFRQTTSMPPLPILPRHRRIERNSSRLVSKYQRRDKDEALTNKLYKLNLHTMRKKSARISMRLSSAFGLSSHTVDEKFNFEEQRFRAMEKFLRLFVRNAHVCMEALKVNERIFLNKFSFIVVFRRILSLKSMLPKIFENY